MNPLGIEYHDAGQFWRFWLPVDDEPPVLVGTAYEGLTGFIARTSFLIGDDFYGTLPQCRDWLWSMWQAAHASLPADELDHEHLSLESEAVL